jgi:ribosome-binding ATPase YchF (GTP1/OBG family)
MVTGGGGEGGGGAGKIHSDIARGFIRAETVHFDDLMSCGSEKQARALGKQRQEGKEYVVKDGDVVEFKFNV